MKKVVLSILVSFLFINSYAQEATVEKSMWGVQIGLPPLAVYHESRLTNSVALRTELNFGFAIERSLGETRWAIIPAIDLEPRYYYNLQKRASKGKQTIGNCGNFISLNFGYTPGFAIKSSNANVDPSIHIIPTWGLKRNIGTSFNYDFAFGIGYSASFEEHTSFYGQGETIHHTDHELALSIRFGIGYKF